MKTEQIAMPTQKSIGLNDKKGLFPQTVKVGKQDQPKAVRVGEHRFLGCSVHDNQLLTQHGNFRNQIRVATRQICQNGEGERQGSGFGPEFDAFLKIEKEFADHAAAGGFMRCEEGSMIPPLRHKPGRMKQVK